MTILVPYRNRPEMLAEFAPHILNYVRGCKLFFIEQADNKPFNRAKLINVGFLETGEPAFFVSHDIDLIPLQVDYSEKVGVTQMAKSSIQHIGYLSGCTMYDYVTFKKVGGYNNEYFHRAEDNEMSFNLMRLGIPVTYNFGRFRELPHPRPDQEFVHSLWIKAQQKRKKQNQLSICKYEIVGRKKVDGYTIISAKL